MKDFDGGAMCTGLELRGESLGMTYVGSWQWRCCLCRYLVEGIARTCSGCFFRVKTLILPSWLDPATSALKRRHLPEGVAVEESRRPCDVMRWLVRIWPLL
jgi:hypothetical protein